MNSVAQVATRDHTELRDLGQSLQLCGNEGAKTQQGLYRYGWHVLPPAATVSSRPRLLPRAILHPWSCSSQGLVWHMWLQMPLRVIKKPKIKSET